MAQPPAYVQAFSFTDYTANYPADQQPGVSLDTEFAHLATTTNAIRANLALIQRDDGALANQSVGPDQVSTELTIGLRSVSTWAGSTAYIANDAAWTNDKLYRCTTSHTSSPAFATDLATKWEEIFDLMPYVLAALQTGAISVDIDTAALQAQIDLKAALAGANVFAAKQTVSSGNATTLADFLDLKPTNFGAGLPALRFRKTVTPKLWNVVVEDGAGGTGMVLDLIADGGVKHNGLTVYDTGNFDPALKASTASVTALSSRVARHRRVAFAR